MGKEREGKTVLHNETNSRILQKTDSVVDAVVDKLINRALVGKDARDEGLCFCGCVCVCVCARARVCI